jgi:hypothetical protein
MVSFSPFSKVAYAERFLAQPTVAFALVGQSAMPARRDQPENT